MHLSGIFSEEYSKKAAEYIERLRNMDNNKDHIERTKRMIEVMQAYVDGFDIEIKYHNGQKWHGYAPQDGWLWGQRDYRIAKTPDTINWDHVSPEFKYMARDEDGSTWLFKSMPSVSTEIERWTCIGVSFNVEPISSYRKGTIDWKESLVIRPGYE